MLDKYSYDYEWDTEYCYPNSYVLKNRLNIQNQEDLSNAEREITSLKIAVAKKNLILLICKKFTSIFLKIFIHEQENYAM